MALCLLKVALETRDFRMISGPVLQSVIAISVRMKRR